MQTAGVEPTPHRRHIDGPLAQAAAGLEQVAEAELHVHIGAALAVFVDCRRQVAADGACEAHPQRRRIQRGPAREVPGGIDRSQNLAGALDVGLTRQG